VSLSFLAQGHAAINHLGNNIEKGGVKMKKALIRRKRVWTVIGAGVLLSGLLIFGSNSVSVQAAKSGKKVMHEKAYALYQTKCLGCHVSVADPEKAGRTRDDWHLVVQVMHGYGLDMTTAESDMIIDLLYDLRKGMEREAG
jgi:hypothetical protein